MSLHGSDLEAAGLIDQELEHVIDKSDFIDHHVSESDPAPVHLRESLAYQLVVSHEYEGVQLVVPHRFRAVGCLV